MKSRYARWNPSDTRMKSASADEIKSVPSPCEQASWGPLFWNLFSSIRPIKKRVFRPSFLLARPKRFELPFSGIGIRCVIQLRHGRIFCSNWESNQIRVRCSIAIVHGSTPYFLLYTFQQINQVPTANIIIQSGIAESSRYAPRTTPYTLQWQKKQKNPPASTLPLQAYCTSYKPTAIKSQARYIWPETLTADYR